MERLTKKQGFTLVEMAVVLTIIAIMLAVVVPLLSTSSSMENEVCEYARAFYFNVQELITDEKLAGNAPEGTVIICVQVDYDQSRPMPEVIVSMAENVDLNSLPVFKDFQVIADDSSFSKFASAMKKLLSSMEKSGYYYAVADSKQRVKFTYFSSSPFASYDNVKDKTFVSDFRINVETPEGNADILTGAYPYDLCRKGYAMFSEAEPSM